MSSLIPGSTQNEFHYTLTVSHHHPNTINLVYRAVATLGGVLNVIISRAHTPRAC